MISKIFPLLGVALALPMFGQQVASEYYHYPHLQNPYGDGEVQFYKDFHQVLIDKNLKPCDNKDEVFYLKVLIGEDATVKYVKDDTNKELAEKNKCAYNLGLQVLRYMNKWNPAEIDGGKKKAVAGFFVLPNDLFENYKEGYIPQANPALFENLPGGINQFRKEVGKKINLDGFQWKEAFKLVAIFVVKADGTIGDVSLEQSSGVKDFDDRIIRGIKSIKKKWNPATVGGVPVNYRFRLPLNFGPM
ncbi:energy transducer TonB [Chryseobacterium sp. MYb264]|uniref:energy transducer TonB n=1 Tax=Chryseobacterium sp. MYb264 TaxID=2745153 RepID=UPI002E11BA78|nr:energy transducer TonB [Chryseobacterium sp. MYb264]